MNSRRLIPFLRRSDLASLLACSAASSFKNQADNAGEDKELVTGPELASSCSTGAWSTTLKNQKLQNRCGLPTSENAQPTGL